MTATDDSVMVDAALLYGDNTTTDGSFEKLNGFRQRLSAADVVYSINALLEEDDKT